MRRSRSDARPAEQVALGKNDAFLSFIGGSRPRQSEPEIGVDAMGFAITGWTT